MSLKENMEHLNKAIADAVPASLQGAFQNTLSHIMGAESGGDRHAKAKTSSATGIFQFTRGTWNAVAKGKDIYDVKDQCDAAVTYTLHNRQTLLKALNREPTSGELYLAHFAGDGTAAKILKSDPNTPITSLMSAKAIKANAGIKFHGKTFANFTAGDVEAWAAFKMDADLGARREYQKKHDAGQTTAEEDEQETKTRNRLLNEAGIPQALVDMIGEKGGILGQLFIAILQMVVQQATPPNERTAEQDASAKLPLPAKAADQKNAQSR